MVNERLLLTNRFADYMGEEASLPPFVIETSFPFDILSKPVLEIDFDVDKSPFLEEKISDQLID
jgi:hypothetical protein